MSSYNFVVEMADGRFVEYDEIIADNEEEAIEIVYDTAKDDGYDPLQIHLNTTGGVMKELYKSDPIEKFHALVLEEFHEFRKTHSKSKPTMTCGGIMVDGSDISRMLGNAKKRLLVENNS